MKIFKYEHSGIVVEKDDKKLVFDPVEFEEKLPDFDNVSCVVITHQHNDHLQPEVIQRILSRNPEAIVCTTEDSLGLISNARVVKSGDEIDVGGFNLKFFGYDHAAIFPGKVPCRNIGVVIDGSVVHPGDSFDLPDFPVKVLLTPIAAPWCRISEAIDYIHKIKPEVVIPIHDAVLSKLGKGFSFNIVNSACQSAGIKCSTLSSGEYIEI